MAIGLLAGIFAVAVMRGALFQRVDSAIHNEASSLQLHNSEFLINNESQYTISEADNLISELEKRPDISAVSKRLKIEGMVNSGRGPMGVIINGIEPEKEKRVTKIYSYILDSSGTYFEGESNFTPVVIGSKLAEKLKVKLNSKVQVDAITKSGNAAQDVFRVIGIFETENSMFDEMNVFIPYSNMADLLEFNHREAHEIAILTKNVMEIDTITKQLEDKFTNYKIDSNTLTAAINDSFPSNLINFIKTEIAANPTSKVYKKAEFEEFIKGQLNKQQFKIYGKSLMQKSETGIDVQTWMESAPDLEITTLWIDLMLYIFVGIILLALGFGIVNTMLMVVLERVKELGMLMAIGMTRKRVYWMVMLETILLSLTGGIAGIMLSEILINYFEDTGISLSSFEEGFNALGYSAHIFPQIDLDSYIKVVAMVILTGIISALYPAYKAIKLNPSEAIRTE